MQPALYRAERPEVFEEIIGQKHIVKILQNQIRTGTVSQAYLFAGTHGTGKTTTARILAKAVNCLEGEPGTASAGAVSLPCGHCENCEAIREGRFVDVIELDAASNNGVDDLRAIIETVKYPPAIGRYKVYIIDEVHMLSTSAENAFLKTLEEPPAHAIFILATTDPQKVRATIRSRCMQLNFRRVTEEELIGGMERICRKRGVSASRDALATIASRADGSVRDSLSILEQCMAAGDKELSRAAVLEYTGAAGEDFFLALTGAVADRDAGKALIYIDEIVKRGKDPRQILKDWLSHYRDLMIVKYVGRAERIMGASQENIARLRALAERIDPASIERAIRLISEYINIGRYSERPRILLETAAVRLAEPAAGASAAQPVLPANSRSAQQPASAAPISRHSAGITRGREAFREERTAAGSGSREDSLSGASPANEARMAGSGTQPAPAAAYEAANEPVYTKEQPGDPVAMWDRIAREVTAADRSFMSMVGRNSAAAGYDSGELTVIVSPGKMMFAEDKAGDITRIAKAIYGSDVYVTLRAGDINRRTKDSANAGISEAETSGIIDRDINVNDVIQDVRDLLGVTPVIQD